MEAVSVVTDFVLGIEKHAEAKYGVDDKWIAMVGTLESHLASMMIDLHAFYPDAYERLAKKMKK
jgi:hypothetical protein